MSPHWFCSLHLDSSHPSVSSPTHLHTQSPNMFQCAQSSHHCPPYLLLKICNLAIVFSTSNSPFNSSSSQPGITFPNAIWLIFLSLNYSDESDCLLGTAISNSRRDQEGDRNELKESCGNRKELKNVWPPRKSFKCILLQEHYVVHLTICLHNKRI